MKRVEIYRYPNYTQEGDCCPECDAKWDGGDIYEHFLEAKFNPNHEQHEFYAKKSLAEIKDSAGSYGWTEETPKRFSRVIGVDCSWDPDCDSEDSYDGISYWQCPNCEIAWHRFNGKRTDKFVKTPMAHILKRLNNLNTINKMASLEILEPENRVIIYNAIQTPDGTVISSKTRHDFVSHKDANGKTYSVDGGLDYLRRVGDMKDCKDLSMYLEPWSPEFHEKARKVVKRGGRGINGDEPLKWVPICEMSDSWVLATIKYNTERGMPVESNWFTNLLHEEMHYRNANSIKIDE